MTAAEALANLEAACSQRIQATWAEHLALRESVQCLNDFILEHAEKENAPCETESSPVS